MHEADAKRKAAQCFEALQEELTDGHVHYYPSLEAGFTCFAPIRHAQTELEAWKDPLLIKVISMMEDNKKYIFILSVGVQSSAINPPH